MKINLRKYIILLILVINSLLVNAQGGIIDSLIIIPTYPTTIDTVKLISYTTFPVYGCSQISSGITTNGSNIYVYSNHMAGGFQLVCYSVDTFIIGVLDAGTYTVIFSLLDSVNSLNDTDTLLFSILPNGLQEYNNVEIKFYPNPVTDIANISLNSFESSSGYQFELYSREGKMIFKEAFRNNDFTFNRNGLASGIYFYQLRKDEAVIFREKVCLE